MEMVEEAFFRLQQFLRSNQLHEVNVYSWFTLNLAEKMTFRRSFTGICQ